ncbi:hypothetical protein JCM10207_006883 [Rhodosporidiobolus poonsookiae]
MVTLGDIHAALAGVETAARQHRDHRFAAAFEGICEYGRLNIDKDWRAIPTQHQALLEWCQGLMPLLTMGPSGLQQLGKARTDLVLIVSQGMMDAANKRDEEARQRAQNSLSKFDPQPRRSGDAIGPVLVSAQW